MTWPVVIGPNSLPLYRPPNLTNSHEEKTGLPPPPTSSISCLKPADRRKTYLITPPDSVSILSTQEEVPRAHRVEAECCAPAGRVVTRLVVVMVRLNGPVSQEITENLKEVVEKVHMLVM